MWTGSRSKAIVSSPVADLGLFSGDGRADHIYVNPRDGALELYVNGGGINPSFWVPQDAGASGVGFSGPCIQFSALTHSGGADYIPVVPSTGIINPWFNGCKDLETSLMEAVEVEMEGVGQVPIQDPIH